MDTQVFSNNARAVLTADVLADDTTLNVADGTQFATLFQGQYELVTLETPDKSAREIIKVIANNTTSFYVERAQEGTAALDWPTGTYLYGRITAGTLSRFAQGLDNHEGPRNLISSEDFALNLQTGRTDPSHYAYGIWSIGLGYDTVAGNESEAIGHAVKALASDCSVQGNSITNRVNMAHMSSRYPVVKLEDGEGTNLTQAPATFIFGPYVDLGVPPVWTPETVFHHGDIVQATVPDGLQHRMLAQDWALPYVDKQPGTSGTVEPVWGTYGGAMDHNDGTCNWAAFQDLWEMDSPPIGSVFIPMRAGFLCHTYETLTGTPVVSIGNDAIGSTAIAAEQPVEISTSNGVFFFTCVNVGAITESDQIVFTINTHATAGRCVGRFFVDGVFVELPVHS